MNTTRLSERVLLVTGDYCDEHMTVLATGDGLVVIDTLATLPACRAALSFVREFSRQPVRLVVNTHADVDHVAGNSLFPGATIVAHRNCEQRWSAGNRQHDEALRGLLSFLRSKPLPTDPRLASRHETYLRWFGSLEPGLDEFASVPPSVLVTGATRLSLGALTLELEYLGRGHTEADLLVRVADEDLLVTGDLVMGEGFIPVAHEDGGGSLSGLRRAVDHVEALAGPRTRIVPGHGPVGGVEILLPQRAYLDALAAGAPPAPDPFRFHYLYDLFHPRHQQLARAEAEATQAG